MLALQEIEKEISILPPKEFSNLRNWFYSKDLEKWDEQIEMDSVTGKLDFLIDEALAEKSSSQLKNL